MIEMVNLTKTFGEKRAVNGLHLSINAGEFFAFLGPNAAGKTTTIKMLVGLLRPSSGHALICGYDIQKKPLEAKRHISYVPDFPHLYEKLSAIEYLEFIGGVYELPKEVIADESQRLLEAFHLNEAQNQLVEDFSHGMKQKLVMCGALLHDPAVIIIDEPMVGLDPRSARILKDILKDKSKEGKTIFMSTHTLSVAEELADRIGIINQGQLIALGTLDEINDLNAQKSARLEETFLQLTQEEAYEEPV
ncbi:MAG: ABC transporter ATP-binding protein [Candidatus Omnitrophica bacterium]|nr:ABC transporter ATP-binding protein [Candidatus Omnitrophota bacterium]